MPNVMETKIERQEAFDLAQIWLRAVPTAEAERTLAAMSEPEDWRLSIQPGDVVVVRDPATLEERIITVRIVYITFDGETRVVSQLTGKHIATPLEWVVRAIRVEAMELGDLVG